jgi:hypothetical protein
MYDPSTLYTDPILTNLSVGFKDQSLYGAQLFPITPVNTPSGRYRTFDRSDWLIFEDAREPGTQAREVRGRKWSEDTFKTREHSLQSPVWDEENQELNSLGGYANAAFGGALQIDPHADATKLITRAILLRHENKVSTLIRDTSQYPVANTVTLSGTSQWDNLSGGTIPYVTSDPVANILTGMRTVWQATRRYPNVLAIPTMGMSYIENHPRVIDRFKNFRLSQPDAFQLLTGFEGKIVNVDSVYNAADNIDATASITDFWGKDVWLGIVDEAPGLYTQTFGKTFAQTYPDGSIRPADRWREESRKADMVRVSMKYDLKIVSNIAGYLIKNAFSSTAF